jgi:hypothetical protein
MAPYMVEVFEDDLFISFYRNYTVMKVSKFRSNPHSLEDAVILFLFIDISSHFIQI